MRARLLPLFALLASLAFAQDNYPLYLKLRLDHAVKTSVLKPGDVLGGTLAQDVYSADHELFPAGSALRLTVDHLERRRRVLNDHWPWVVRFFSPRHENFPAFRLASVASPGGWTPLQVSLIAISGKVDVHSSRSDSSPVAALKDANASAGSRNKPPKRNMSQVVTLQAAPADSNALPESSFVLSRALTIPAETHAAVILLTPVSASKSKPGDAVTARLVEPVRIGPNTVLPEGTLFHGNVLKRTPPRWLSRPGSILFSFSGLSFGGSASSPISASVSEAEFDRGSHTRVDPEGQLRGGPPGKAWLLIDAGVTAGIAKEADDTLQLIIEAIVSSATDASTAGVGRIAAAGASGVFMITRHGRDVILPQFTEMDLVFDRPATIHP